jgi:two-component system sensor histidine kinase VicK
MERLRADLFSKIESLANIGSYVVDMQKRTWTASQNMTELFNLPPKPYFTIEEFYGLVHPDDREEVITKMRTFIENQQDIDIEYRYTLNEDRVLHVKSYGMLYYDEQGNPLQGMGIIQDITLQRSREIEQEELIRLLHKKDQILGMVAHDLLTPISVFDMYTGMLREDLEGEQLEMLEKQQQACNTAKSIVNDLIEFTRMQSNSFYLKLEMHTLNDLILGAVDRYRTQLEHKELVIHTDLVPNLDVKWDARKFNRALDNLLYNAIKFSPTGSKIEIATQLNDGRVRLSIADQGIGIAEEHFPKLFEQFSPELRRQGTIGEPSTGLGLSIVKEIIDMHHGTITVKSKIDQGTTFTLEMDQYVKASYPLQH